MLLLYFTKHCQYQSSKCVAVQILCFGGCKLLNDANYFLLEIEYIHIS